MSNDLQVEADRRNAERLGHPETPDVGEQKWWLVRDSRLVLVRLKDATDAERKHLSKVANQEVARSTAEAEAHRRFLDFVKLHCHFREGEDDNIPVSELCKRAGLTLEQAWALAQAKGKPQ